MEHARLLRPFPTRALHRALYHVEQDAATVSKHLLRLMVDTPSLPEDWSGELHALADELESLAERCLEARLVVVGLARGAEGDFRRATDAMLAVLRGMGEGEAA